jgi:hypothetical protein
MNRLHVVLKTNLMIPVYLTNPHSRTGMWSLGAGLRLRRRVDQRVLRLCSGLARYVGDWASDATWVIGLAMPRGVKDLHCSLVPLVKDARYVGCESML